MGEEGKKMQQETEKKLEVEKTKLQKSKEEIKAAQEKLIKHKVFTQKLIKDKLQMSSAEKVTTQDVDLEKLLSDGTKSYIDQIPIKSKEKFSKALEIVNGNFNLKTCTEVVVMKYIYARSCTRTGNYQDILSGHSKLTEIKDIIQKVKFPAVFYGFALLYKKLNRYEQALEYTEKGLEWFNKGLPCLGYNYPGDDKKIEETDHEFLVVQFEKLRAECKCPPKPEAICRQKHCLEVNKELHIVPSENIHLNDPDYQGYYTVLCRSNCSLDYHHPCWERQK